MDTAAKGALARACLIFFALLWAAGFAVFLAPVSAGIINIGNAAGMFVCAVLFFLSVFWNRFFRFMSGHKAVRVVFIAIVMSALLLAVLAAVNGEPYSRRKHHGDSAWLQGQRRGAQSYAETAYYDGIQIP